MFAKKTHKRISKRRRNIQTKHLPPSKSVKKNKNDRRIVPHRQSAGEGEAPRRSPLYLTHHCYYTSIAPHSHQCLISLYTHNAIRFGSFQPSSNLTPSCLATLLRPLFSLFPTITSSSLCQLGFSFFFFFSRLKNYCRCIKRKKKFPKIESTQLPPFFSTTVRFVGVYLIESAKHRIVDSKIFMCEVNRSKYRCRNRKILLYVCVCNLVN